MARVRVDGGNRLRDVLIGGQDLDGLLGGQMVSAKMSYAADQIGQFTLEMIDNVSGQIVKSGLIRKGVSFDYGDQQLVISSLSYSPAPGGVRIKVDARSRLISSLRKQTGKASWGTTSVAGWVSARVAEAQGTSVQQELGTESITRQDGNDEEASWDVMRRLADTKGAWCFECDNAVTFGKPSWIAGRPSTRVWSQFWNAPTEHSEELLEFPGYEMSEEGETPETLTVKWLSDEAEQARPGQVLDLGGTGVGAAAGRWILTGVDDPISRIEPFTITAQRIVDPVPPKSA
ncbi:hypothetical protein D1871_11135 [Nakamurella silvestris]|nr:hypothetical protein D1871_11135 [Nakamurella silvestris]